MKKTKTKKKRKGGKNSKKKPIKGQKVNKNGFITPEDFLFGLLVTISVAFVVLCISGATMKMAEAQPMAFHKPHLAFQKEIKTMVNDHPIKDMAPYIARQDKQVAAFLLAIARKESDWGEHSPKKNGKTCYNYWGFRGSYNQTASGYSCFKSPKQAVEMVGDRISELVLQDVDTPREMVVWKCGARCDSTTGPGAGKWIRDVSYYYNKIYVVSDKSSKAGAVTGKRSIDMSISSNF